MFRSTGSSAIGFALGHASTMPRSMRSSAARSSRRSRLRRVARVSSSDDQLAELLAVAARPRAAPRMRLVVELEGVTLQAVGDDAVPDRPPCRRCVRAAPPRSRFRAARGAGRRSSPRRGRCRLRPAARPARGRAAAGSCARPRRRRRDGRSAAPIRWLCSSSASSVTAASARAGGALVEQQAVGQHGDLSGAASASRAT